MRWRASSTVAHHRLRKPRNPRKSKGRVEENQGADLPSLLNAQTIWLWNLRNFLGPHIPGHTWHTQAGAHSLPPCSHPATRRKDPNARYDQWPRTPTRRTPRRCVADELANSEGPRQLPCPHPSPYPHRLLHRAW
jgi:hypothetical protein